MSYDYQLRAYTIILPICAEDVQKFFITTTVLQVNHDSTFTESYSYFIC